jgi:hypothetical protein
MLRLTWAGVVGYIVGVLLLVWAMLLGLSGGAEQDAMVKALLAIAFFAGSTGAIVIAWYFAWLRSHTPR